MLRIVVSSLAVLGYIWEAMKEIKGNNIEDLYYFQISK
jgi:hypothetical protein